MGCARPSSTPPLLRSPQSACNTVAAQLGYANQLGPSGTYGPYFAYDVQATGRRRQLRQLDGWYYFGEGP